MRPPSVDSLARSLAHTGLPHPLLVDAAREAIASGDHTTAGARADAIADRMLRVVINATGVLLHTNLGRAPWAATTTADYTNLELDLATGQRGSRQDRVGRLFARLCDAEAAMVVNNCAGAVLLVLAALAAGRGVAVSRSELVEIGGGFRVPEVMTQSGAHLVEVGTTNRTRRADYATAVSSTGSAASDVALVMKVHQSNYRIVGFTEAVAVADLVDLGVPVVADIGSGLLDSACPWLPDGPPGWLEGEPAARQTLAAGADLVTFSGDKLLGGPQAGIIAGHRELVDACGRHPLARALRPGALVVDALQRLALAYLARDGEAIPFWRMAVATPDTLRTRADAIADRLGDAVRVVETASVPGGGTLPGVEIPSAGLALDGDHTAALRHGAGRPPIIARVVDDATCLDLRTVAPAADTVVADALRGL